MSVFGTRFEFVTMTVSVDGDHVSCIHQTCFKVANLHDDYGASLVFNGTESISYKTEKIQHIKKAWSLHPSHQEHHL